MTADVRRRSVRGVLKSTLFLIALAVALFWAAGRVDWLAAWVYVGAMLFGAVLITLSLDPELLAERSAVGAGVKPWDLPLVMVMARLGPLALVLVAGLDARHGWTAPLPLALPVLALLLLAAGYALTGWAMRVNRFFSGVVRIQSERGHTVVMEGPYRYVRHPGYTGMILTLLVTPLLLGSLWAWIPAALTVGVTVARTALEDRALRAELPGYAAYAQRVRYRLLPGVW